VLLISAVIWYFCFRKPKGVQRLATGEEFDNEMTENTSDSGKKKNQTEEKEKFNLEE